MKSTLAARTIPFALLGVLLSIFVSQALLRESVSASVEIAITGYLWSDTAGWIDLNCSNANSCGTNNFGLSIGDNNTISGYAWGDNIGWVSANSSDLSGCPSGTCAASISGGALSGWLKAVAADGNGWDGFISLSGSGYGITVSNGSFSGYAWGDTNLGWLDSSNAHTLWSTCTPSYSCAGQNVIYTDANCSQSTTASCVAPAFCSAGASQCLYPSISFNTSGSESGHLQVKPALVLKGRVAQVYWDVSNATSCSVSGSNGDAWTGLSSGSGGKTSSPILGPTTYTLTCEGYVGALPPSIYETDTVNVTPTFQEK